MDNKKNLSIKCRFKYKIYEKGTMMIYNYAFSSQETLPDGTKPSTFKVKGYLLPEIKELDVILTGSWEKYHNKRTGDVNYTFCVDSYEEIKPEKKDGIIAYLQTLQGVGKKLAERMYKEYGLLIFDVIEKKPEKLSEIKGINEKKAQNIAISYGKRRYAKELFQYLFPFHIKDNRIIKAYKMWGDNALDIIKNNPYRLTEIYGIGFDTAEMIARKEHIPKDFLPRIEAAIMEVLIQGEKGGPLFSKKIVFPKFMWEHFLSESMFITMLDEDYCNITGGTYLPRNVVYLMTLKLLEIPLSESDFDRISISLHTAKRIFIDVNKDADKEKIKYYRYSTAKAEFAAAKKIASLMKHKLPTIENLDVKVYDAEKKLQIRLSDEQVNAVKMALSNPISIITGGPGTGKTSIQKGILNVFKAEFPNDGIMLAAPTGQAAKRMHESTGYTGSTLHKALNLYAGENGETIQSAETFTFTEKLIIIDECSMLGSLLFNTLLEHVREGTRVVMVGDIDQLPSIEVGAVLRELINSGIVPVTKLTKTFRQASGSNIAVNASRIKKGEHKMSYGADFQFIDAESSHLIAEKAAELYPSLVNEHGIDNVVCLSAYRKSTESGTNHLNQLLRTKIRNDITEDTPFFERKGIRYYQGDRVMFTRNTEELTNGDIGKIIDIKKGRDLLQVTCIFESGQVCIEDDDINYLELALSVTVHKSQGSEYPIVLMICDAAHKNMLKRNLIYTGITRAKKTLIVLGQKDAFNYGIDIIDSNFRRSQLGFLVGRYSKDKTKPVNEQLKIAI